MRYLKWDNAKIGIIDDDGTVCFSDPSYNTVVKFYTRGQTKWTPEQFGDFLADRIFRRDRLDIEKIIFRCVLST